MPLPTVVFCSVSPRSLARQTASDVVESEISEIDDHERARGVGEALGDNQLRRRDVDDELPAIRFDLSTDGDVQIETHIN